MSAETGIQRIIVPIDTSVASEQALPLAVQIAAPGDTIVLLHVLVPHDGGFLGRNQYVPSDAYRADLVAHLAALAARVSESSGINVETAIVEGKPAEAISAFQRSTAATMIVMTTAGRGAAGRLRFGSVADQVVRTSPIPVVLVRLRYDDHDAMAHPFERVLVPLDGSGRADRALPMSALLASRLNTPVTVLNVMEVSDLTKFDDPEHGPSAIEELIAREDVEVRKRLDGAVSELESRGLTASWKVISGNWAAQVIEDEAGPHDLIVMASHGRGGVRRWLFGSVAEGLVRSGRSPVMLVPSISETPPES